jgi:UDP-N-acetylmuramoylalanine-D-glutamate ligase
MPTIFANPGQVKEARNSLVHNHPVPLKIAILGAGIEGLAAVIAFSRQGHTVTVSSVSPHQKYAQLLIQVSSMTNLTVIKKRVQF